MIEEIGGVEKIANEFHHSASAKGFIRKVSSSWGHRYDGIYLTVYWCESDRLSNPPHNWADPPFYIFLIRTHESRERVVASELRPTSGFRNRYPIRLLGRRMHKFYIQNVQLHCYQTHEGHYYFLAIAAVIA